ncbi:MAG TPA: AAA family ATPase [Candidatus Diapherotrites archaeon]|nr:AAA family ATPase [Candidatus Diapherotrites archaeon]
MPEIRVMRGINEVLDDVKDNISLQLQGETMPIPVLVGNPGIAKTAHAKIIAKEMGMELLYISCAKPLEYFSGLPLTNVLSLERINAGDTYCFWSQPEIIYKANSLVKTTNKPVLILFDDMQVLTGGEKQAYFFELVLERSLHGYKLNKDVAMLGSMNHSPEDGFETFYPAIVNRFQWFFVNMPFQYWYQNMGAQLDKYIAGFLKTNPEYIEEQETTDGPFATYRAWTQLSTMIKRKAEKYEDHIEDIAYKLALSMVSQNAANALRKSIVIQKNFNFEEQVKKNKYKCDKSDSVAQFMFSNIVRYLEKEEQFKQFEEYVKQCAASQGYDNLVVGVMLELRMLLNALKAKDENIVEEDVNDPKKKEVAKRTKLYQKLTENLISDINVIRVMKTPLL